MDTNNSASSKYFLPVAVILAGVFIAGAVLWSNAHPGSPETATAPKVDIKDVNTDGNPFIGQADAPVTIAFWSDFQCPYCRAFEVGGIPQIPVPAAFPDIIKNYVETGKVKVVFMDVAFLGKDSIDGGLYSYAVWNLYPEQYFAWRTAMYEAQDEEGDQGFGDAASIDALNATIPGLDVAKIAADVKANGAAYQAKLDANRAELQKVSDRLATPSLVVGKQLIAGAYPYATFQTALDALLK